jgi:hypothetical protein
MGNAAEAKWRNYLLKEGKRQLSVKNQHNADIAHVVCWIGDIAFVYIEKLSKRAEVNIEVSFPELMNLQCISHPEIHKSEDWQTYKITDYFLIIF